MSAYEKIKAWKCVTRLKNMLIVDLFLKKKGTEVGDIWSQLFIIFFNYLPGYIYDRKFSIKTISPLLLYLCFILYVLLIPL